MAAGAYRGTAESVNANEFTIRVTQVKSGIGAKPKARGTLRALGLGRIGKTNTLPDRPEIRGMIRYASRTSSVSMRTSPRTRKGTD